MAQAQDPSEKPNAAAETPDEIVIEDDEIVVEEAPTGASATATATLTDEKTEATPASERVVYVATPVPPKLRSNRVVGSLLALLGAVVFAVVYALIAALLLQLGLLPKVNPESGFGEFIQDAVFWVPVLFFAIGFVLIVLLLNRAAWWLHVLGSLLVALIVYFGSIAMLLLVTGIAGDQKSFVSVATSAYVLIATFTAREVSIWIGFLIALRGGRVKELNKAAREAFDSEQAAKEPAGTQSSSTRSSKASDGAVPPSA
jgi:hypothetical protein